MPHSHRAMAYPEPLRKTKLCKFHHRGACARGNACSFAHSTAQLQEQPDFLKSQSCNGFLLTGKCRYGTNCKFAHGEEELRIVARREQTNAMLRSYGYFESAWPLPPSMGAQNAASTSQPCQSAPPDFRPLISSREEAARGKNWIVLDAADESLNQTCEMVNAVAKRNQIPQEYASAVAKRNKIPQEYARFSAAG